MWDCKDVEVWLWKFQFWISNMGFWEWNRALTLPIDCGFRFAGFRFLLLKFLPLYLFLGPWCSKPRLATRESILFGYGNKHTDFPVYLRIHKYSTEFSAILFLPISLDTGTSFFAHEMDFSALWEHWLHSSFHPSFLSALPCSDSLQPMLLTSHFALLANTCSQSRFVHSNWGQDPLVEFHPTHRWIVWISCSWLWAGPSLLVFVLRWVLAPSLP